MLQNLSECRKLLDAALDERHNSGLYDRDFSYLPVSENNSATSHMTIEMPAVQRAKVR